MKSMWTNEAVTEVIVVQLVKETNSPEGSEMVNNDRTCLIETLSTSLWLWLAIRLLDIDLYCGQLLFLHALSLSFSLIPSLSIKHTHTQPGA